jgi:Asp-tRNA(Asn)/Glu-tRNA(Gln) amidotransferase A subunit family amidase
MKANNSFCGITPKQAARQPRRTVRRRLSFSLVLALLASSAAPVAHAQEIDVQELTIEQVQKAFAAGTYTSEQLTKAFFDRISKYDPYYNTFIAMNPAALEQARAIDKRRAAGEKLGPLAGVPVVVKDSMDMAGLPTTGAWAVLSSAAGGVDLLPEHDAPVVGRLRAAGAILIGKANLDALSASSTNANTSWRGPVFNVVNRDFAPGASSSGSAAAIGANFAVVGLGEETGGSIQNPAGAQSVVAVKPTFGLVPNIGVQPASSSLQDVMGPFARTVRDVAIALDTIAGYTIEDPKTIASVGNIPAKGYAAGLSNTALHRAHIGLYGPGWGGQALSPETEALYESALAELKARGALVVKDPFSGSGFADLRNNRPPNTTTRVTLPYDFQAYLSHLGPSAPIHTLAEFRALPAKRGLEHASYLGEEGDLFGKGGSREPKPEDTVYIASLKDPTVPPDTSAYIAYREASLRKFREVMAANHLDALVFPQVPEEYPRIFSDQKINATTGPLFNIANLPGVVVPAGAYKDHVPFAIIFIGDLFSEGRLLGYAYDYEQATHHRMVPTLVTERYPMPAKTP